MSRRYTHVQELLPEIKAMLSEGRSQREIAEHLGLRDKNVVKELLKRERRKERKIKAGLKLRPKGRPRKKAEPVDIVAEQAYAIKRLKMENELLRDFCSSQKGSEGKGKVHGNIPAQGAVSHIGRVSILWSIQERILRFLQANWRSGTRCGAGRASSVTALSSGLSVYTGRKSGLFSKPKN